MDGRAPLVILRLVTGTSSPSSRRRRRPSISRGREGSATWTYLSSTNWHIFVTTSPFSPNSILSEQESNPSSYHYILAASQSFLSTLAFFPSTITSSIVLPDPYHLPVIASKISPLSTFGRLLFSNIHRSLARLRIV